MANLVSTYGKLGRWEKAEQLEVLVMETCKTKLDVGPSRYSLGRHAEAISLPRICLAKHNTVK
ncbi:kinesin [Penicillium lagena]|uniref:kinesin n=1 Tax=Penicillium lagena TaxID=94218 RepID=UPI00253F7D83|nr:kinesin [Penicillium lagena]KAJ5602041.1 kinesin [Penicillium lagena]